MKTILYSLSIILTILFLQLQTSKGTDKLILIKKTIAISNQHEGIKMLVFVDHEIYSDINFEITRYISELSGEGFSPELHIYESGTPIELRSFIATKYHEGFKGMIMIGNLPLAYYRTESCTSHIPQNETFPCDLFYMDIDGVFSDSNNDGIFDSHTGNVAPEMWFGRLFAHNLTFFDKSESELLRHYFNKNHLYRSEMNMLRKRALVFVDDDFINHDDFAQATSLAYDTIQHIFETSLTTKEYYTDLLDDNYELIQVCVHGLPNAHTFIQPNGSYSQMYASQLIDVPVNAHFVMLYGCSNAKYTINNNIAGTYTFHNNNVVASVGSAKSGSQLIYADFYEPFGNGSSIGEAFLEWFRERTIDGMEHWERCCFGGMTIIGDPTLKMQEYYTKQNFNIVPQNLDTAYSGIHYLQEIEVNSDDTQNLVFELISGTLPSGINLNQHILSGTAHSSDTGAHFFTIRVSDPSHPETSDFQHFCINVNFMYDYTHVQKNLLNNGSHSIFYDPESQKILLQEINMDMNAISLYHISGKKILEIEHIKNSEIIIDLSHYNISSGLYIICTKGEKTNFAQKIIIK